MYTTTVADLVRELLKLDQKQHILVNGQNHYLYNPELKPVLIQDEGDKDPFVIIDCAPTMCPLTTQLIRVKLDPQVN